MAGTGWFCPCTWGQRVFYMGTTHLLTYTCSHCTCALLCWQGVLNICTPLWKYVTGFLKPDVVSKVQFVWIWKVLNSTNSWEECSVYFNEPRQISCGSSSFGCVRIQGTLGHSPLCEVDPSTRVTSMKMFDIFLSISKEFMRSTLPTLCTQ